jgi:membrane protein DedA with SNARE-associated domain
MAEEVAARSIPADEPPERAGGAPEEPRKIVLDLPSWIPADKVPKWVVVLIFLITVTTVFVGITISYLMGWLTERQFETLGYPGIFLANFFGTATVFIPVPGLTAAGQALIIAGSQRLFVPGVVAAGALGMTLAESTAYLTGAIGRGIAEKQNVPIKGRFRRMMQRIGRRVDWLMARYGFVTLLTLSAIPNPFFEFAGITAGAVRMNFWRFLLAVGIGKTTRVILLVIVGDALIRTFSL